MEIKIYPREKELGLEKSIIQASTASVAAVIDKDPKHKENYQTIGKKFLDTWMSEYESKNLSPDMMLLYAVLVSTTWNKNDDVFTPDETWKARYSPRFKPANLGHIGRETTGDNQTIGVIRDSFPCKDDFELLDDYEDSPPEDFKHIINGIYLWEKYWPSATQMIKDGINNGTMFVSMECIFSDFGYALRRQDNSEDVMLLPRNEITSWLSKSLRILGGSGSVNIDGIDYQIGRWLRNLVFSGIGFVENPANTESIIFEDYISHASINFKNLENNTLEKYNEINFEKFAENRVWIHSKGEIALWLINS